MNGNALSPAAARDAHGHEGKDHDRDFTHVYRTTPVTPRLYKLVVGAWIYACAVAIYALPRRARKNRVSRAPCTTRRPSSPSSRCGCGASTFGRGVF